jgi:argininosuccinate lyase
MQFLRSRVDQSSNIPFNTNFKFSKVKLWDKGIDFNKKIEDFTVGKDRELDLLLAPYDVLGSIAHIIMLEKVGLLTYDELIIVKRELVTIYNLIQKGEFSIDKDIEDVHSQVEYILTQKTWRCR